MPSTSSATTCRCGAVAGDRGAHDMFGDWHSADELDHMPQIVQMQAFRDVPEVVPVVLDAQGRCETCRERGR